MIDPKREKLMSLGRAARHRLMRHPVSGRVPHLSTMVRRVLDGIALPDGTRVCLEAVRMPGGLFTSAAAIERFIARLNQPVGARALPPRTLAADIKELEAAGIR